MRAICMIVALTQLASCDLNSGPDRVRVLGSIAGYNDDDPQITLDPDGRNVTVAVTTYGSGCHTLGETEVEISGLEAKITPFDYTAAAGTGCDRMLRSFVHSVTLSFASEGTARIQVRGIDNRGSAGDTLVIERAVELRISD